MSEKEIVLALDVSTKCTGYGVAAVGADIEVLTLGVAHGKRGLSAWSRIRNMIEAVNRAALAAELDAKSELARVVIEDIGRFRKRGPSVGHQEAAVGAFYGAFMEMDPIMVSVPKWTRGRSKAARLTQVCVEFPEFAERVTQDRGGELADVLGLLIWYQGQRVLRDGRIKDV